MPNMPKKLAVGATSTSIEGTACSDRLILMGAAVNSDAGRKVLDS